VDGQPSRAPGSFRFELRRHQVLQDGEGQLVVLPDSVPLETELQVVGEAPDVLLLEQQPYPSKDVWRTGVAIPVHLDGERVPKDSA
jgi:hypothetical protein